MRAERRGYTYLSWPRMSAGIGGAHEIYSVARRRRRLRVHGQEDQGSKVRRWRRRLEHLPPSLSSGNTGRGDAGFESNSCLRLQSALVARVGACTRPLTDLPCHTLRWSRPLSRGVTANDLPQGERFVE